MEKQNLPNATAVIILSIISIITCCCFGIIGVVFGVIALFLANKDMKLYRANPELYANYNNLNTGRILAIIGTVLSVLTFLYFAYVIAVMTPEQWEEIKTEYTRAYEEAERNQNR